MTIQDSMTLCIETDRNLEVVLCRLEPRPDTLSSLNAMLSLEERARADRIAFDCNRRRYIAARGYLRVLLAQRLCTAPESIEIGYRARGKPVLAGQFERAGLHFNLSHSEDIAAYIFSRGAEVGIDIERIRPLSDAQDVAARFFSEREYTEFLQLGSDERTLGFFNCWTRKEAFVKGLGDGLHYPSRDFDVSLRPDQRPQLLRVGDQPGSACGWSLDGFSYLDCAGAIAVQRDTVGPS